MDNLCELKLNVFSAMHRMMDRALHLEQALEGLVSGLSQAAPLSRASVVVQEGAEVRFFFAPSPDGDMERRVRGLYKTGFDLVMSIPQTFTVLGDSPGPLFLDRKALQSLRKDQVRLLGAPVVSGDEVAGAILVERFFGDRVPVMEDVELLTILAVFIGRVLGLRSQVKRREEALVKENRALRAKISEEGLGVVCLGGSEAARRLEAFIRKAAPADAPVHIRGEPGTGKSSIAKIIHELSARSQFPFVRVHCSLPEDLLEKELFGSGDSFLNRGMEELHAPVQSVRRRGAFERAVGGTLLLDEVGDLSIAHQAKLLDMLEGMQGGSFGSTGPKSMDVRIVSVACADLSADRPIPFRQDLLNRLSTLRIHVPPVRERKEDIPLLIGHFMEREYTKQGRKTQMSPRVLKMLCEYAWPGNIAEIKNAAIRLAIMAEGPEIEPADIDSVLRGPGVASPEPAGAGTITPPWSRLDKIEIKEVSAALERNKWVRRKAADDLGLTFRQMNYRVKKFGLDALIKENRKQK